MGKLLIEIIKNFASIITYMQKHTEEAITKEKLVWDIVGYLRKNPRPIVLGSFIHGSGRSTLADMLAEELELAGLKVRRISSGEVFRELAEERGRSIDEFVNDLKKDLRIDLEIDRKISKKIKKALKEGVIPIVDSNLAPFYADGINILVKVDPDVAGRRVFTAKRGTDKAYSSPKEAEAELVERMKKDFERYKRLSKTSWVPKSWKGVYKKAWENFGNEDVFEIDVNNSLPLDESFNSLLLGLGLSIKLDELQERLMEELRKKKRMKVK